MATETAVGRGSRILISDEYDTQTAEERYTAAYRAHPEYKNEQTPWAQVQQGGWGALLKDWYRANGVDDSHVTPNAVFRLGVSDDGGRVYQAPAREHYDVGRAKQQPLYRQITVYPDLVSLAQRDQAKLNEQAEADRAAKESELARLQNAAASGDLDKQIADAKIRAGLGVKAKELTIGPGGQVVYTALSPAESMDVATHKGKSIIDPGMWERVTGGADPGSLGLPMPLLAMQPDGRVSPAREEYESLLAAARAQPPGPFQFGGGFSAGRINQARMALQSLGIPF